MSRMLVIDTETGGVDPRSHSILSFAAVVWDDGKLGAEFTVDIIEPVLCVTPQAMAINRIDLGRLGRTGVTPSAAIEQLQEFLRVHFSWSHDTEATVVLAGHNVNFDIGFLKRLCELAHHDFSKLFSHRLLDTASILRFLQLAQVLPIAAAGSTEAFAYFDIVVPPSDRHTALGDARATALLITKLLSVMTNASLDKDRAA